MYHLKIAETVSTYRMTKTLNLVGTEFREGKLVADTGKRAQSLTVYLLTRCCDFIYPPHFLLPPFFSPAT